MPYKPVQLLKKVCAHCQTEYYAKDRRRMYCSNSCNTLAWMRRKNSLKLSIEENASKERQTASNLRFSASNLATIAGGALTADLIKKAFSSQPSLQQIHMEIGMIRKENEELKKLLLTKINSLAGATLDVKKGLASLSPDSKLAIISSERERMSSK